MGSGQASLAPVSLATVSLDDKYTLERGRIYITGTGAGKLFTIDDGLCMAKERAL